ncbi:class I SAM-dependent methyltransferase [Streptomyces sp. NPDC001652]|uniref:class I SAM-dependent methyltransferase n=1 Tax=Streptomyces sp. NPDC001652 TaxID=3154393 RepID=UPI00332CA995
MGAADPSGDRQNVVHRVRHALRHPGHTASLRAVTADGTDRSPEADDPSREGRAQLGRMQFDYLLAHGLRPEHHVLEIGCGNLRAGRLLIDHLDTGHYYGIDISPAILLAAQGTLVREGLQAKLPHLTLVGDLTFGFLPEGHFDVVHAHSVFSHSPRQVVEQCLAHVGRILAPGGHFDFTFNRTEGREHQLPHEDFSYRTRTLTTIAARHGLKARFMDDWERLPHRQSKIRVTLMSDRARTVGP